MKTKLKIIIGIALIPVIIYLWPSALGGNAEFLLVQGQSMLPTIEPGSFVVIKSKPTYEIGDIVSYSTEKFSDFGGRTIVHRIIKETNEGFIIKGDNNPKPDPGVIAPSAIRGEVVLFTPFLGYVLVLLRNPLVMGVLAVVMLMAQMKSKKKKKNLQIEIEKKPKKKKNQNYVLFLPALAITLFSYIVIQLSLDAGIRQPKADPFTSLLFSIGDPYIASTISFALYFLVIIGFYYWAKTRDTIPRKELDSGVVLTLKKTNPVVAGARIVWLLFIILGILFLIAPLQELRSAL
ncbi:MAG: signal peptidase I [Nitrosopumilaceae archaeon]